MALRKAEREAGASKETVLGHHIPPRSKFDSPNQSLDVDYPVRNDVEKSDFLKSASVGGFPYPSSSSNSGGESSFAKHSRKRSREHSLDRTEVPSKKASTSFSAGSSSRQGHYHRHHHRSHQKTFESQSDLTHKQSKSDPSDKSLSSRHRSRSSSQEKSKPSESAPTEPTSLNTRLPPGRAPIIDGSRLKYLEEVEEDEDDDDYANIEAEVYGGEDGELLRANGVEMEVEVAPQHDRTPVKPFYLPSIQGCRSVDEFECLNRIEEGTYGVVYRARDKKTNEVVALKRLKMEKEREGFPITSLREINTLMKAQHENIVTVREVVVGFDLDKIYLVMEYVEHDLKSLMEIMSGPFTVGQVKCLLIQLLRAVQHLHDNWILHRDLKTSNLLLSHKGILKVGDFGLAREYGSPLQHYTEVVVTLWYRAIELLLGRSPISCSRSHCFEFLCASLPAFRICFIVSTI